MVTSMLEDYLDVTVPITKCFHIGKKDAKSCLLKVTVGTLRMKKSSAYRKKLKVRNPDHIHNL